MRTTEFSILIPNSWEYPLSSDEERELQEWERKYKQLTSGEVEHFTHSNKHELLEKVIWLDGDENNYRVEVERWEIMDAIKGVVLALTYNEE